MIQKQLAAKPLAEAYESVTVEGSMRFEIRLPVWFIALLIALLLHAFLAWRLLRMYSAPPTISSTPSVIPVRWASSTSSSPDRPSVYLPKPKNEQEPQNPRVLSAWNSQTQKETIRRGSQKQQPSMVAERQSTNKPPATPSPTEATDPLKMRNEPGKEDSGKNYRGINLIPPTEVLQRIVESSQSQGKGKGGDTDDDLEDVTSGTHTELNSKSFMYATFFDRIKREIKPRWHPAEIAAQYDPGGKVHGHKKRITTLRVTLDKEGNVTNLEVVLESGFPELDTEAEQSFRRAESFPNPPRGLIQPNGLIQFRFSFILYWIDEKQRFFMRGQGD